MSSNAKSKASANSLKAPQKTIVVVGAGFFGIATVNRLIKANNPNYRIVLISLSNYTVLLPASVRAAVANQTKDIITPLKDIINLKAIDLINDEVINFNTQSVFLKKGQEIKYDALVIATGSKFAAPIGITHNFKDDYKSFYAGQAEKFKNAKDIVFIGGGHVNCEVVGELLYTYGKEIESGEKNITMIHNCDLLLADRDTYTLKLREKVTDYFVNKTKVNVILSSKGDAITKEDGSQIVLVNGGIIPADLVLFGVGVTPSVPPTELQGLTNPQGFISIHNSFLVSGIPNTKIFSIGDVTDFDYKGILTVPEWEDALVSNIQQIVNNPKASESHLKRIKRPTGPRHSIVSLGPKNGIGQLVLPWKTVLVPKWANVYLKSKNLLVEHKKEFYQY